MTRPAFPCPACGNITEHRHMHDCPHGIAEAHMAGTERFVCETCGHATFAHDVGAAIFPFTLDKVEPGRMASGKHTI
jgi:hypothetical protein